MNVKAILFSIIIVGCTVPFVCTAQQDSSLVKRTRRARLRAQNKTVQKEGPPQKRFDNDTKVGSVHATYMHMSYQELEQEVERLIAEKYYDVAIKYLERMVAITTEKEEGNVPDLLLKIADILYLKEDYQKAWRAYAQWELKYPGAYNSRGDPNAPHLTQAEYALFRAVYSSNQCIQDIDRDQTQTHATVELATRFLQKKHIFTTYTDTVVEILAACYEKLIASDLAVCDFYRKQGNDDVVHIRLALLDEEYAAVFSDTKKHLCAYRSTYYPDMALQEAPSVLVAESQQPKTHAADRF